ncbi:hypothetical protein JDS91_12765 [Bacillus cereus]|nr:hypothetical protein [Bacillus cereus]
MLPFSYFNSSYELLKRFFIFDIEFIGIIGMFNEFPLLYVIGEKDLPNRRENKEVDEAFVVVLKYIYKEYSESMLGVSD